MRRSLLGALIALFVVAWPAHAQVQPAPAERVIMDTRLMVIPPAEAAPCMRLEAGRLTITARNTGESGWSIPPVQRYPVTLYLYGYRGEDQPVDVRFPITEQESTTSVMLAGALYCWSLAVDAPVGESAGMSVRTNYSQFVALRMTHVAP